MVDIFDIFDFFCSGEGKGESEATRRAGGRFFIENPRGGLSEERKGGGGRGPGGRLQGMGRGAKFFFFGAEMPAKCKNIQNARYV